LIPPAGRAAARIRTRHRDPRAPRRPACATRDLGREVLGRELELGKSDMVARFRDAPRKEDEHLLSVRRWYVSSSLAASGAD